MPLQELLRRIEDLEIGLQSVNVNIPILSEEAASTGRLMSEQFALNSSTQNIIFDQSQISLRVQEDNTKAVERLKALLNSQNQQIETLSKRLRETENLLLSALFKASQTSENSLTDALLFSISEKFEEPNETIPTFNHVSVHLPPRTKKLCYLRVNDSNQQSGYVVRLETGPGIFAGECLVTNKNGMASLFIINTTEKEISLTIPPVMLQEFVETSKPIRTIGKQDEPTTETRVVLCVLPKTPGCTPAGKVLPEDSQGPAALGTTPTARSSKRARENLIGAPEQSQEGKTFHSYVNEIGIDIRSPAEKFKLSDWGGRNNGRNDDVHIQETSDAVEHIESIRPVSENVEDIGHIVDEIEVEPVKHVGRPEGYKSGKPHTSLLTKEESGKPHTSLLTEEESGKPHTSLLTEEESGKTHTSLLTEEESGTSRDIDKIDYKLGQLGISPPGTAAWDTFPIKMNDQFKRQNVELIHKRRKETSQTEKKSSLRDLGYNWKAVDLLSKSEMDHAREGCDDSIDDPEVVQVHRVAALPLQGPNVEAQVLNNEYGQDEHDDEVQIVFEGLQRPRLQIRDASKELRHLVLQPGIREEDEGYASGEKGPGRLPLDQRLQELGPQLLERPMVNLDMEMIEIMQNKGRQNQEEPVLIENEHLYERGPPFLIEVYLGEFGNPLPIELIEIERAPAPGLYEAVAPFQAPAVPRGLGARAVVEALHRGLFRMQSQAGLIQISHAHGLVALSPDRAIWRCHACVIDEPHACNGMGAFPRARTGSRAGLTPYLLCVWTNSLLLRRHRRVPNLPAGAGFALNSFHQFCKFSTHQFLFWIFNICPKSRPATQP
ncbi:hypothetical protein QAD02_020506 [Eretmocerus hayati]|uniref:Uncharacterized protein n=1 Tax=Eretmocerus hayati TaxID=131215 RepID=A0ACC2PMP1_9HYME|nr:hypothetical protein QAD02_020506 [Eretmocerus hayati]